MHTLQMISKKKKKKRKKCDKYYNGKCVCMENGKLSARSTAATVCGSSAVFSTFSAFSRENSNCAAAVCKKKKKLYASKNQYRLHAAMQLIKNIRIHSEKKYIAICIYNFSSESALSAVQAIPRLSYKLHGTTVQYISSFHHIFLAQQLV